MKTRTELIHQRHEPETIELLKKAAEKTRRTATRYVEHAIRRTAEDDGIVLNPRAKCGNKEFRR